MKRKNMGLNAVLSAIKTALGIIFPLITFPYATRILGVENIGIFNFSSSVVSYTGLFAALGVRMYAIRECSMVRDDKNKVNNLASSLFSINFGATVIAYAALAILCLFIPKLHAYWPFIAILSLEILFTTVGCEWIYSVYEDFLYVTIRSLCVHTLSLVLLFVFVHTEEDLINYTIISTIAVCGANLANIIGRRKYCRIRLTPHVELKKHLPPIMVFFLNAVSTTIYVNSDVLILGFMTNNTIVGLYTVAARIYTIIKNILASVITVSVPRLSAYWAEGDRDKVKETCDRIFSILLMLTAPAMIGLLALSRPIVLLLSGAAFEKSWVSLSILSVALLVSVFCWFFKSCVLVPSKHEKAAMRGTVAAAITNIVLNFILIPFFQEKAAAFTTFVAEGVSLGIAFAASRKVMKISITKREVLSVLIGCGVIVGICAASEFLAGDHTVWIIAAAIPLSVLAYGAVLLIGKHRYAILGVNGAREKVKKLLSRRKDRQE